MFCWVKACRPVIPAQLHPSFWTSLVPVMSEDDVGKCVQYTFLVQLVDLGARGLKTYIDL